MNDHPSSENQVFLSHAGEDEDIANRLAANLTKAMLKAGRGVTVFNTSDPAYRFHDFIDTVSAGEKWDCNNWEQELQTYLRSNMESSAAYLLLVTPRSLEKNSRWIDFEIRTAAELHHLQGILYIPCAHGPGCLSRLPHEARVFQGIDVSTDKGFAMLFEALDHNMQ